LNNQPSVCICIPNYNNEKTISKTIDSLLNQTYKNIIIKVFDNASTDNSFNILKEYEQKYSFFTVFRNNVNLGGEANFTKCFEYAEGDYVVVFHSDDVYESNIIEEQVKFLEENRDCSAVSTHANYIDENDKGIGSHFIPMEFKNQLFSKLNFEQLFKMTLKYGNFIICPSVMSRTNIIQEYIKFWDFDNFKTSSDFDVWLRLSKEGSFGFINKSLINYRMSNASYSYTNNRIATQMFDMFLVFEYYLHEPSVIKILDKEDYENYNFQYNKSCLSVNINKYLTNKGDYIKIKKFKFKFKKPYLLLHIFNLAFNIIKYIKLPSKLKQFILTKKVDGKWFR